MSPDRKLKKVMVDTSPQPSPQGEGGEGEMSPDKKYRSLTAECG